MVIDVKLLYPNALDSMLITEDGIVMELNPVTPWKALSPILVTEDGIVRDVRPLASWNAASPMLLYVAIRTLVAPYNNAVAPVNDPLPLNTLVSHDILIPDLPYNVLPLPGMILGLRPSSSVDSSKMALVIPELKNALEPILLTEDGIVIDVNPVAPWKALAPILL